MTNKQMLKDIDVNKPFNNDSVVPDTHAFIIEPPAMNSEQMRATVQAMHENKTKTGKIAGVKQDNDGVLTPKQRMFVSLVTQGNSPRDAYRKAYSNTTDNEAIIGASANRLMNSPKVKRLLSHLWDKQEKNIIMDAQRTRLHIMEELLKHSGNEEVQISARLKALELMGKAVGMFTDKVETKVEQISAEQLKDELSQHLSLLDSAVTKH
jgi:hypothetical protein